jgi:hypothetical protein
MSVSAVVSVAVENMALDIRDAYRAFPTAASSPFCMRSSNWLQRVRQYSSVLASLRLSALSHSNMPSSMLDFLAQMMRDGGSVLHIDLGPPPPVGPALSDASLLPPIYSPPVGVPSTRAIYIPVIGDAVEVRLPMEDDNYGLEQYLGGSYDRIVLGGGYSLGFNGDGRVLPENVNFRSLRALIPAHLTIVGPALLHRCDPQSGEDVDLDASITVDSWKTLWSAERATE